MGHYKSNLRDLKFNLFEFLQIQKTFEGNNFGDLDRETAENILAEVAKLTEGPVAEQFAEADRNPPVFNPETHSVSIPAAFKKVVATCLEAGWQNIGMNEELGGIPAPRAMVWAVGEMFLGAQPAAFMYLAGGPFANILYDEGTEEQKKWAKVIAERQWGSTMVLTEPDAGSDVGAATTKAIEQPDGTWHIEGVKRFITSGDSDDMFENIFHLVLARPIGAKPGTKGLSLFFVPKFHFNFDTAEMGERNGVFVTGVEHKMGLKVSATCEVSFGLHGIPAKGWLVGNVHNGIAQMFEVIEHARMMVGTKAIATLSTGYLNALAYAKERVQGSNLVDFGDKTAPKVTIINHPDVRRSLMVQKSYAEGLRALYLFTSTFQDAIVAQELYGIDADLAKRVNDLLLPVVKGVGSERAYEKLTESLQCFGGSGFIQDYPIEQYIRDAKIDSLYEGTTAIQAQDFFFRKIAKDQGKAIGYIVGLLDNFIAEADQKESGDLSGSIEKFKLALADFKTMLGTMTGYLMACQQEKTEIQKIGLVSVKFLMAFGDLLIGYLLLSQAQLAIGSLSEANNADKAFYEGKIAAAKYFANNVLPEIAVIKDIVANVDNKIMQLDEAVF